MQIHIIYLNMELEWLEMAAAVFTDVLGTWNSLSVVDALKALV